MIDNQRLLSECRALVEKKLAWGSSSDWKSQDFENLSDRIFEKTNVVLSASTLKRIWGRVRYESTPSLSTLDALARFVDHPTWRAFAHSVSAGGQRIESMMPARRSNPKTRTIVFGIIFSALLAGVFLFNFNTSFRKELTFTDIHFSSSPVTTGVPNTVIFHYDVTHSNADSVFIQQNWDSRRRFSVPKARHEYASTYYMPGYYRAKLVLDETVVSEHDVFIESPGWMGLFQREPVPDYLSEEVFDHGSLLGIKQIGTEPDAFNQNLRDFPFVLTYVDRKRAVSSRHFALDMEIQNTFDRPNNPCRRTQIVLLGTDGVVGIPLSAIGCVGELQLRLGENVMSGTTNNLSAFGVNFDRPIRIQCTSRSDRIQIEVDGKLAYEGPFEKGIGEIVGVRIVFEGIGYIQNFSLRD